MKNKETKRHVFAVCAYGDSPWLKDCIRSLKRQTVPANIIICTSTPSEFISGLAKQYGLPLYIREGKSNIQDDWNFAWEKAQADLVTLAHQDDIYRRDYLKYALACFERYPDTTVFTTDCAVLKDKTVQRPGLVAFVKKTLRLPLRLRRFADRTAVKRAALIFGNPIICPSCTYHKAELGEPLFQSRFQFALDWDTLWTLTGRPGRFVCEERPLLFYRIHAGSETKKCIEDHRRSREELAMYTKIWPKPAARLLMRFYRKAYDAYR